MVRERSLRKPSKDSTHSAKSTCRSVSILDEYVLRENCGLFEPQQLLCICETSAELGPAKLLIFFFFRTLPAQSLLRSGPHALFALTANSLAIHLSGKSTTHGHIDINSFFYLGSPSPQQNARKSNAKVQALRSSEIVTADKDLSRNQSKDVGKLNVCLHVPTPYILKNSHTQNAHQHIKQSADASKTVTR